MEPTAQFNLEQQIAEWRSDLSHSDCLSKEDLNELESHLLDEIEQLNTLSLSPREAFLIARDRIGSKQDLQTSYTKSKSLWFLFKTRSVLYLQAALMLFILTLLARLVEFTTAYVMHYFVLPLNTGTYLYLGTYLSITIIGFVTLRYFYGQSTKPNSRISFTGYLTITILMLTACSMGIALYMTQTALPMEYFTVIINGQYLWSAGFLATVLISIIFSVKDFKSYKLKTT